MSKWYGKPPIHAPVGMGALSEAQAERLAAALPGFTGRWSLDRHDCCDGDLLLLVSPDSDAMATFTVDATPAGITLSVLRADVLRTCGRFATIESLIIALRALTDAEMAAAGAGGTDRR